MIIIRIIILIINEGKNINALTLLMVYMKIKRLDTEKYLRDL